MPKLRHEIWKLFTETVPRVKGQKDHPAAQCNACKFDIRNAMPSGNMLRHVLTCPEVDEETLSRWKEYDVDRRHAATATMVTPPPQIQEKES
ncbi:hypothetical protein F443_07115 [Phytophthora nicotianae P1569]|uniref:BED-type domain-containing protein n=1 Tax=Phytophthora nicotianae P1569 TaxID=1317065 RepID=V9FET1_PHYNI|nr:hypothetical protein F443_07115 [Phytophthora nicotianae P1569]